MAKILKGTDGGLLGGPTRQGFLERFRALEAGSTLPADQRFGDAATLDDAVTNAAVQWAASSQNRPRLFL
jgi:hypothetical protein